MPRDDTPTPYARPDVDESLAGPVDRPEPPAGGEPRVPVPPPPSPVAPETEPVPPDADEPRRRGPKPRPRLNLVLFLLTVATTTYWGFLQYQQFYFEGVALTFNPLSAPGAFLAGAPFGLAVIAFLLAHEMGHYLACRYYGIRATLPYFIPIPIVPFVLLPGTMGAVIRIISPIKHRRALFDIAVAGPIAGFVVSLPILATGLSMSRVVSVAETQGLGLLTMGEPLLWGPMETLFAPAMGPNETLLAHPLAFVGWFAMLVTAMNLLPVGQLDGGHILYALTPRYHRVVSLVVVALMLYAGYQYFLGWFVFAALVFFFIGTRHPRPLRTADGLDSPRAFLALVALAIFVLSFILVPVSIEAL